MSSGHRRPVFMFDGTTTPTPILGLKQAKVRKHGVPPFCQMTSPSGLKVTCQPSATLIALVHAHDLCGFK